jgi:hypothetical protein
MSFNNNLVDRLKSRLEKDQDLTSSFSSSEVALLLSAAATEAAKQASEAAKKEAAAATEAAKKASEAAKKEAAAGIEAAKQASEAAKKEAAAAIEAAKKASEAAKKEAAAGTEAAKQASEAVKQASEALAAKEEAAADTKAAKQAYEKALALLKVRGNTDFSIFFYSFEIYYRYLQRYEILLLWQPRILKILLQPPSLSSAQRLSTLAVKSHF